MHLHGDQRLIRQTTVHVVTITGRDSPELWCHRDEVMDLAGAWWELFGRQHLEEGMMANGILERIADGRTDPVWASWYARSDEILRRLCYGEFSIHPDRIPMQKALLGTSHGRS